MLSRSRSTGSCAAFGPGNTSMGVVRMLPGRDMRASNGVSVLTPAGHVDRSRQRYELGTVLLLGGLACVVAAIKLALALQTRGTNDVVYWEMFLATLKEHGGIAV